ncbi:uncharacterized protein LOC129235174 [Uloborus diversus]|uniref:uncharacterized protein LOC129235174 n=1 Tax=Uloborus diversus TaxID=327109 RepID=UPI0024094E5C|nr:uncharacterized protein LOC129235174 [Uloborus diversus]
MRRDSFEEIMDDLFDIAHANALEDIKIEEDRKFLILQRQKGRPGSMVGVDLKLTQKEERKSKKNRTEVARKKRTYEEMERQLVDTSYDIVSSNPSSDGFDDSSSPSSVIDKQLPETDIDTLENLPDENKNEQTGAHASSLMSEDFDKVGSVESEHDQNIQQDAQELKEEIIRVAHALNNKQLLDKINVVRVNDVIAYHQRCRAQYVYKITEKPVNKNEWHEVREFHKQAATRVIILKKNKIIAPAGDFEIDLDALSTEQICRSLFAQSIALQIRDDLLNVPKTPLPECLEEKHLIAGECLDIECPDGSLVLEDNLCYKIYNEPQTWNEAYEICEKSSSFLLNDIFPDIKIKTKSWLSLKYSYGKVQSSYRKIKTERLLNKLNTSKVNPDLHCVSVVWLVNDYELILKNCSEKLPFVCLYEPYRVLSTVRVSKIWNKYSNVDNSCYYIGNAKETWEDAVESGSWWMKLFENETVYQWLNSSSSKLAFVDWDPYAKFNSNVSAPVLVLDALSEEIKWSLDDPYRKHGYICEIEDCKDLRPTQAYIEDRTIDAWEKSNEEDFNTLQGDLRCVPSGWFNKDSVVWYKDGILCSSDSICGLPYQYTSRSNLKNILQHQGYYWCSVEQKNSTQKIFSSKLLHRTPGIHTFVLSMQLEEREHLNICTEFMMSELVVSKVHSNPFLECFDDFLKDKFPISYLHVILRNVSLVCPQEQVSAHGQDITWPSTAIGQNAIPTKLCVSVSGNSVTRKCSGDFNIGAKWESSSTEQCMYLNSGLTKKLYELAHQDSNKRYSLMNIASNLNQLTTAVENLTPLDIHYVAEIMEDMVEFPVEKKSDVLYPVIQTFSNIIEAANIINSGQLTADINRVLLSVKSMIMSMHLENSDFRESTKNIAVSAFSLNSSMDKVALTAVLMDSNLILSFDENPFYFEAASTMKDFEAAVEIPRDFVTKSVREGENHVFFMIGKNFYYTESAKVVSPLITVFVGEKPRYDIDPPIKMLFKVEVVRAENVSSLKCVHWDQKLNNSMGDWSWKGCFSELRDNILHCSCDHLTSFAVVLDRNGDILVIHQRILSTLTFIGCSISCFGLIIIILTFILFRKWRTNIKNKALFNFSLALLSFLIIFMSGVEVTNSKKLCVIVSVLLHYFLLSSFAWMLVTAILQYYFLVRGRKVLDVSYLIQKAAAFAWGVPLFFIGIVLCVNYEYYMDTQKYCLLSGNISFYTMTLPVLLMLGINFLIFGSILYTNTCGRPSSDQLRSNQDQKKIAVMRTKALFCISVLLGLSWIFGFLALGNAKLWFHYLFTLTTTLQGFFMFIIFVVRYKSTRDMWKNFFLQGSEKAHISNVTGMTDVTPRTLHRRHLPEKVRATFHTDVPYVSFSAASRLFR